MKTSDHTLPAELRDLAAMAVLLERLERQPRKASAEQYRHVVQRVTQLLNDAEPGEALHGLLAAAPATAEIYENLHYEHAGLCLAPLERAMEAERAAVAAIERSRGTASAA